MPQGKQIQIAKGEYPELDGIEAGREISFEGTATVDWKGETGTITFQKIEFETENSADKALSEMTGKNDMGGMMNEEDDGL